MKIQLNRCYGARYLIELAESADEGLEILDELVGEGFQPLVIISDWLMPGMRGDAFLIEAHKRFPHVIKVMLSGQVDEAAVERTRNDANLHQFIVKPWSESELVQTIDSGIEAFHSSVSA